MNYLALTINNTPIPAPAQIPGGGSDTLNKLIGNGITIVLIFAVIYALFILIRGGIEWISSEGDKQKLAQARSRIVYAIIGLVLTLVAFGIVNMVFGLFNLPGLKG
jgi:hypothetical protein